MKVIAQEVELDAAGYTTGRNGVVKAGVYYGKADKKLWLTENDGGSRHHVRAATHEDAVRLATDWFINNSV